MAKTLKEARAELDEAEKLYEFEITICVHGINDKDARNQLEEYVFQNGVWEDIVSVTISKT